ncbi:MAG: carbohydrate-binding protein [Chloroflexota bacterium]
MRKRMISAHSANAVESDANWLPLEKIASVEISSEEASYPIENALLSGSEIGWRAAHPGEQIIRIIFDAPQTLRHIRLVFVEQEVERSQEFSLRWSPDDGKTFHEIVRQQWNFSPHSSAQEREDYQVELSGVTEVELKIVPDRTGGAVQASLLQFRLA